MAPVRYQLQVTTQERIKYTVVREGIPSKEYPAGDARIAEGQHPTSFPWLIWQNKGFNITGPEHILLAVVRPDSDFDIRKLRTTKPEELNIKPEDFVKERIMIMVMDGKEEVSSLITHVQWVVRDFKPAH